MYYTRYQDVLRQINTENALAEEIRQYNESLALEKQKLAEEQRQFNAQLAEEQRQFNTTQANRSSGGGGGSRSSGGGGGGGKTISGNDNGGKEITSGGKTYGGKTEKELGYVEGRVDMNSVMALGKGPLTASELNRLVETGKVIEYDQGGKLRYKWKPVDTSTVTNPELADKLELLNHVSLLSSIRKK